MSKLLERVTELRDFIRQGYLHELHDNCEGSKLTAAWKTQLDTANELLECLVALASTEPHPRIVNTVRSVYEPIPGRVLVEVDYSEVEKKLELAVGQGWPRDGAIPANNEPLPRSFFTGTKTGRSSSGIPNHSNPAEQ